MQHPAPTKTVHHASYAAIDPTQPELSAMGKTVIVTGAGEGGIGAATARSFARAGADKIALIGRTAATLEQTKDTITQAFPATEVRVTVADVSQSESVAKAAHEIRAELGAWDVFVHAAVAVGSMSTLAGADEDEWWQAFETNIKFSVFFAKHFLPKAKPGATYIGLNAGAIHVTAAVFPLRSAYAASKLAVAKLDEFLAAENPDLRVFTLHPGLVNTNMVKKAVPKKLSSGIPFDEPELPANAMVWLATPAANFLRGRYIWAGWDVTELMARKAEIEQNPLLFTTVMGGWPFT